MAGASRKMVVKVEARQETGKNVARRLRAQGKIPGTVYGLQLPPFSVTVNPRRVEEVLRTDSGRNTIFTLSTGDGDRTRDVMFREMQRDPVTERLIHVDFLRLDPKRKVEVEVPVRLIGTPVGVKNEGGIVDFIHRRVEVSCMPGRIPEYFDVDVSGLHVGQHVSIRDLSVDEDVEVLDPEDTILAVISVTRVEEEAPAEEAEPEAEAAEAEPEVAKKGKEAEAAEEDEASR